MRVDFVSTGSGLTAKFKNLSSGVPDDYSYQWNFGDGSETSTDENPSHTYAEAGFFTVLLNVVDSEGGIDTSSFRKLTIVVTDYVCTHLPASIYKLIDQILPPTIYGCLTGLQKQVLFEKWQTYLYPLVNHCIPPEEYNNELYYEALENQLIMTLAAREFLYQTLQNLIGSQAAVIVDNNSYTAEELADCGCGDSAGCRPGSSGEEDPDDPSGGSSSSSSRTSGGDVKAIKTGPSEVEFFNESEAEASSTKNLLKAAEKDNLLDRLNQEACMLAGRLEIFLPFCDNSQFNQPVVPKVVNRRRPGLLDGPDPWFPVSTRPGVIYGTPKKK